MVDMTQWLLDVKSKGRESQNLALAMGCIGVQKPAQEIQEDEILHGGWWVYFWTYLVKYLCFI